MFPLNLFYSYCHADDEDRSELEKHLSMLVNNKIINQWHDGKIIAGQSWKKEIIKSLTEADIVVFLITPNWLNSKACIEEWDEAKKSAQTQKHKRLIPVISKTCAWLDFDDMSSYLALPKDGVPVSMWPSKEEAWQSIYTGLKNVAEDVKKNFELDKKIEENHQNIEFCSSGSKKIILEDVFVFPNLTHFPPGLSGLEVEIENKQNLFEKDRQFIIGDSQSGKSKFSSWLFLELVRDKKPCIHIDFESIGNAKDKLSIIGQCFRQQFRGDFETWLKNDEKSIIFDNLTKDSKCIELISFCEEHFKRIIIFSNSDIYNSYYNDDERFADYRDVKIKPFCHAKQEELIQKWIGLSDKSSLTDHALIDSLENKINSIVISNKVLPRYPFFILSILQTHESFMPENLKISAYGHCYHALILARLIKSGIEKEDSALETAFSFCSNLAFEIHSKGNNSCLTQDEFNEFYDKYSKEYLIKESVKNRLFISHGLLKQNQNQIEFSFRYSYYYFLGKYLSENHLNQKNTISKMIESSYARHNSLILIFTIHHANDLTVIDEILTHTMCAIDELSPAKLTEKETSIFSSLVKDILPEKVTTNGNIHEERKLVRKLRSENELTDMGDTKEIEKLADSSKIFNQIFQSNKNIEILSQILKNKTGSLKKSKLLEIVETICDAGLRLASVLLVNQTEIEDLVQFVYDQYRISDEYDPTKTDSFHLQQIRNLITVRTMLWVLYNIEKSVNAINKPELKDIVCELVESKSTPAYDLIKYFYLLDSSLKFESSLKKELEQMTRKYTSEKSPFLNRIVSIRTQHYEKTHKIKEQYRQSIFSLLKVPYKKSLPSKSLVN